MTLPLFVYGTLRDAQLRTAVLGRTLRPQAVHPARAPGFRAVHYPGRIYPALLRAPGAAADGLLLLGLTPFETDLLDAFEGDEYRRGPLAAMLEEELHEADAYLPAIAIPASAPDWTLERWQAEHKSRVLSAEAATADELRQRLIAVRPH
jgi:hypothetical protein